MNMKDNELELKMMNQLMSQCVAAIRQTMDVRDALSDIADQLDEMLNDLDELDDLINTGPQAYEEDFDDNEPNLCDKCERTINRKRRRKNA